MPNAVQRDMVCPGLIVARALAFVSILRKARNKNAPSGEKALFCDVCPSLRGILLRTVVEYLSSTVQYLWSFSRVLVFLGSRGYPKYLYLCFAVCSAEE